MTKLLDTTLVYFASNNQYGGQLLHAAEVEQRNFTPRHAGEEQTTYDVLKTFCGAKPAPNSGGYRYADDRSGIAYEDRIVTCRECMKKITPTEGNLILLAVQNYWGKGKDYAEAMRQIRKVSGKPERSFSVIVMYDVTPDAAISDMGYLVATHSQKIGKYEAKRTKRTK